MTGSYSPTLVALSIFVAMMASYIALDLAGRVTRSSGRAEQLWLVGGAFAMGAGIWSMHFIGMLAFSLPVRMVYDLQITLVSMLFAILSSGVAIYLASRARLGVARIVGGGVFMGAGICAMHYTGMAAMRMSPPIRYDPVILAASVAIAVAASMVALWLAFQLRSAGSARTLTLRALAAAVMGLAIAGMHYTGMAAADFLPGSMCLAGGPLALAGHTLAFAIGTVILCVFTVMLIGTLFDLHIARRTAEMAAHLQKVSEELERSNQELEQFAYVVSHDLRAPLRSVTGFVELLQRRLRAHLDKDCQEYVQFITESVRQMDRLIQALLQLGRVGKGGVQREPVAMESVLADARQRLEAVIRERGAQIVVEPLPCVAADPVLMVQVLQNLVGNAIKFQPDGVPLVRITARRGAAEWVIGVSDRGIGIDREHYQRIFQIFQRLHSGDAFEGDGVGLALCEKIVRLHGGRIWVDSQVGAGSTFFFSIPDLTPEPRTAAAPVQAPGITAARPPPA